MRQTDFEVGHDIGLLTIRLVLGLTLAAQSAQKLFGWFDGPGIAGTTQSYRSDTNLGRVAPSVRPALGFD